MQILKVSKLGMIKIIVFLSFLFSFNSVLSQTNLIPKQSEQYKIWNFIDSILTYHCTNLYGDTKRIDIRKTNILKNRIEQSSNIEKIDILSFYTFDTFNNTVNDKNLYSNNTYAEITGRVIKVEISEPESCNCNNKDYRMRDIHIKIIPKNNPKNTLPLIVEISPRVKMLKAEQGSIIAYSNIKKQLLGKVVTFQGWMFYDEEHFENSKNSIKIVKSNSNIWRQSAWEIHPIINFFVND